MRVQCQRTRRYIPEGARLAGGIWICPHCPEGETYLQAEIVDPELVAEVKRLEERARAEFGKPDDGVPTRVWLGESPQTVFEVEENAFHLYLDRSSNWLQFLYSGAHEAFHRVCSKNASSGHWADEMLAVHFALRQLDETGREEHAGFTRALLREEAASCPLALALTDRGYPPGLYGRCFLIGATLIELVGWAGLTGLVAHYDADGIPDVDAWAASLSPASRAAVKRALAP